jgi:pilus assembly protein CpaC
MRAPGSVAGSTASGAMQTRNAHQESGQELTMCYVKNGPKNGGWLRLVRHAVLTTLLALSLIPLAAGQAGAQGRVQIGPQDGARAGEMSVPVGKSQVLRLDRAYTDLSVGDPKIADIVPITDRSIYVLGKKIGTTNLTIYGANKQIVAVVDLAVTSDVGGLKSQLHELMPSERIEVRAVNDSIILSGDITSPQNAHRAAALAERYAPEHVINQMRLLGAQQVMLQVKVAEIKRQFTEQLGLKPSFNIGPTASRNRFTFNTLDPVDITRFAVGSLGLGGAFASLNVLFDALERKGIVKTLAEPNLIALSGDTASFLAGGEFPVPVSQNSNAGVPVITVAFKQFGVSLAFTPTVLEDGLINLVVAPEVSQLDATNGVTLNGFFIPGITTRRATTTVELRDGQGFAIAGLLQNDITNAVRQLPGLGQVPVLGALFRDTAFQRNETELVIIVMPRLVKPAPATAFRSPTDSFVPASQVDGFLFGRVEGPGSGQGPAVVGGGLTGNYGHIIR